MSLNSISNKFQDSEKKNNNDKDKRKFIFTPFECVNYSKFDEMCKKLDHFYNEVSKSFKEKTKNDNDIIKKGFFSSLEMRLIEISLVKDQKMKITKIDEVFKWFKKKLSSFQKIKMDFKTPKSHFEKYPVLDKYKKSETYELNKVPFVLEKENRSLIEEGDNTKERLKQLKIKGILQTKIKIIDDRYEKLYDNFKSKEISFQIEAVDQKFLKRDSLVKFYTNIDQVNSPCKNSADNRLPPSASSNQFRSNNHSNDLNFNFPFNFNSSNSLKNSINALSKIEPLINGKKYKKDGELNDLLFDRDSSRDFKSSSSPFRPIYDYTTSGTDKQNLLHKDKDLSEKENKEEMKEYLKESGINKPWFKEEVEKNNELKKLDNNYENFFKEKQEENKSNVFNLENLNLKKTMSPSPFKIRRDKISSYNSINYKKYLKIISSDNFIINSNKKVFIEGKKEDPNFILKNKIRNANKIYDNFDRLNFNKVKNYQQKQSLEGKESYKSMRNFYLNHQLKQNLIKISVKFNEIESVKRHLNIIPQMKKSLDKISSETAIMLKTHDKKFDSRQNFSKLLQKNEIDEEKDYFKFQANPLSLYDNVNVNATSISPIEVFHTNGYATGFDFTYKNSEKFEKENFNFNSFANSKNNFLLQRTTVSFNNRVFANNNSHLLTQKQKLRKNNYNFSHDAIKKAFLPPADDKKFPKYFLPQPGFGLLTRSNIKIEKN